MNITSKVELPRMIRCGSCKRNLLQVRYSNVALARYKKALEKAKGAEARSKVLAPFCNQCADTCREEMYCQGCNQTLSLDYFSKAQRKHSDEAYCRNCQQERDDRIPDVQEALEEEEIVQERLAEMSDTSTNYFGSLGGSSRNSRSGFGLEIGILSNAATSADGSEFDGVWLPDDQSVNQDLADSNMNTYTWNHLQSEQSVDKLYTSSDAGSWNESTSSLCTDGHNSQASADKNAGFAKLRSMRNNRDIRIDRRVTREVDHRRMMELVNEDIKDGNSDSDSDFEL